MAFHLYRCHSCLSGHKHDASDMSPCPATAAAQTRPRRPSPLRPVHNGVSVLAPGSPPPHGTSFYAPVWPVFCHRPDQWLLTSEVCWMEGRQMGKCMDTRGSPPFPWLCPAVPPPSQCCSLGVSRQEEEHAGSPEENDSALRRASGGTPTAVLSWATCGPSCLLGTAQYQGT